MTRSFRPCLIALAFLALTPDARTESSHAASKIAIRRPGGRERYVSDKTKNQGDGKTEYGLTKDEEKRLISDKQILLPYYPQNGETCGIYALKMTMAYHHALDCRNQNPPARKGEAGESREAMYEFAKRMGYLWKDKGETTHWNLDDIASAYGYSAKSRSSANLAGLNAPSLQDLRNEVNAFRPVVVSVRKVDQGTGRPSSDGDEKGGHWVVVHGFVRDAKGREFMVVTHGWSGGPVLWSVADFEPAWAKNWRATVFIRPPHDG